MKPLPHYLVLIVALLAFSTLASAATVTSTVNRSQVGTNETLTLRVSIDKQVDSSELDLSALQENFEILNATPQSRSSFNMINGKSEKSASTTWTITLIAKNEGILTIPAFTIKSASSRPISIKVNNAAQGKNSNLPLEVQVSTNTKEVYPNQQLIVEIELSAGSGVRDLNGPQLVIPNADVEAFDQQNFQRVDNGVTRQIVVLKYSVFASQVGELIIPIMTYTGLENGRRSFFGSTGKQVIARSKQLKINVKNVPDTNNQQWFPADDVSITSNWSADTSKLVVGEPITRTITVTAKGQQASAIPPLDASVLNDGLKSYRDQPQLETSKSAQGFVATRIESEAIVANQAEDFVMPAITIDWWNTKTEKWETARLEEKTLNITGVALAANTQDESHVANNDLTIPSKDGNRESTSIWQLISALLSLLVLVQFYFLIKKDKPSHSAVTENNNNHSEREAWTALQVAIKSDNNRAIRNNLLSWGRAALKIDGPVSLELLANSSKSQDLGTLFAKLERHLYQNGGEIDSAKLNSALTEFRATLKKQNNQQAQSKPRLNPLYPN